MQKVLKTRCCLYIDNSSGSDREDVSKSRQNSGGSHEHAEEGMTDLYILNLDSTYVEEPELYAKLLDKVEEITDSDVRFLGFSSYRCLL